MSLPTSPDDVMITQQYVLQCATEKFVDDLQSPFHLGPLDHLVFRGVPIEVVFVYNKPTSTPASTIDQHIPIDRLKQSLCRLLDYYPHLTDRLHFDAESHTPQIIALNTGAELVKARYSQRLDTLTSTRPSGRLLITNLPGSGLALITPFDLITKGVSHDPILAARQI